MVGLKEMIRVVLACETDYIPLDGIELNPVNQDMTCRYVLRGKDGCLYGFNDAKMLFKFCNSENRFYRRFGPLGWDALTSEQLAEYGM